MSAPENVEVKICGLKDKYGLSAAINHGADYIGFVFVPESPRAISVEDAAQLAHEFGQQLRPEGRKVVAVMVNPNDKELAEVLSKVHPDILQLHGNETPERVREIAGIYDIRIMKALPIANKADVEHAKDYVGYADMLLFDAKAAKGEISGGLGKVFDWKLLSHLDIKMPWFLSGGLNAENLREAIEATGAKRVDVSSGVEKERGEKDAALIRKFLNVAKPNHTKSE